MASIIRVINAFKPLDEEWTKDDVTNCILKLQQDGYKPNSLDTYKIVIKKFFHWQGKKDIVEHLKIGTHNNSLRREDILTVDEINTMIESADSPMYKALLALLFESGARINEVLAVKRKDVIESERGLLINIPETKPNKNGEVSYRRSIYPFSAQFIRNHITFSAISPGDRVFKPCHRSVWEMLRKIAQKAGVTKSVNPHAFRHAAATDALLRGFQEVIIKKKFGWSGDSRMLSRYIHLIDEDVINETLLKAGMDIPKQTLSVINQPEPLKIVDAAMQLSKLAEENENLKSRLDEKDKDFYELKRQMDFITAALQAKSHSNI